MIHRYIVIYCCAILFSQNTPRRSTVTLKDIGNKFFYSWYLLNIPIAYCCSLLRFPTKSGKTNMSKINDIAAISNVCRILSRLLRTISWEIMRRTSSIIPYKKDNLSVYTIRKVCCASLLGFKKKQERLPPKATTPGWQNIACARNQLQKLDLKKNKKKTTKTTTDPSVNLDSVPP